MESMLLCRRQAASVLARGLEVALLAALAGWSLSGCDGKDPSPEATLPCWFCDLSPSPDTETFTSEEMEAVVSGTWQGSFEGQDGFSPLEIEVEVVPKGQAGFSVPVAEFGSCEIPESAVNDCDGAVLEDAAVVVTDREEWGGEGLEIYLDVNAISCTKPEPQGPLMLPNGCPYVELEAATDSGGLGLMLTFTEGGELWANFSASNEGDRELIYTGFIRIGARVE